MVASNTAGGHGGGVFNSGSLSLVDTTISDNQAATGGGLYNDTHGTVALTSSTLSGNTASSAGGGAFSAMLASIDLANTTVSGNSAFSGAGLYTDGDSVIHNATITSNSGGGLVASLGTTEIANSIIAANTGADDVSGSVVSLGYNLIGPIGSASGFAGTGDQVGVNDPVLGPLLDHGGPTQTHALLPGSPAIDAGSNTWAPPTDQRGAPRLLDGPDPQDDSDTVATIDIGAFEFGTFFVNHDSTRRTQRCWVTEPSTSPPRLAIK